MLKKSSVVISSCACVALFASMSLYAANDAASFGRTVKYLDVGAQQFPVYWYLTDLTGCDATIKCVKINDSNTMMNVDEPGIARIDLPAYASNSLICASISPSVNMVFRNRTTASVHGFATIRIDATIQSAALNNPALINKVTGQPFNGKIEAPSVTRIVENAPVPANDFSQRAISYTRQCVNGLISSRMLQDSYGLTASQARAVFANPMTVTLSASGSIQYVDSLSLTLGFRLFGD